MLSKFLNSFMNNSKTSYVSVWCLEKQVPGFHKNGSGLFIAHFEVTEQVQIRKDAV